jgi:hypothetical protein
LIIQLATIITFGNDKRLGIELICNKSVALSGHLTDKSDVSGQEAKTPGKASTYRG